MPEEKVEAAEGKRVGPHSKGGPHPSGRNGQMLNTTLVKPLYPWSLLPAKRRVDRRSARSASKTLGENFRWLRNERIPENCTPWVLGQELGWVIKSPVDVRLTPLSDVELASQDVEAGMRATRKVEFWGRGDTGLAVEHTEWLHRYQYKTQAGWHNMFIPNGQGSLEWHLGWTITIPDAACAVVVRDDLTPVGLSVPTGILGAKLLNRPSREFSVAVTPTQPVVVKREQPLARLLIVDNLVLQAKMVEELE